MESRHDTEAEAFDQLFREQRKMLCSIANRIVHDKYSSEDIVQEVFLKLWSKRSELQIESTLKQYICRSVANAALDYIKKEKRIIALSYQEPREPVVLTLCFEEPEDVADKLESAIESLPCKCKTVFILSRIQGLKYREIAQTLNISTKTVETQMRIALSRLRKIYKSNTRARILA